MRKVKYQIRSGPGKGEWINGDFHGFFAECVESRDGNMNYTVALVEREDGSVKKVDPEDIVFLTPHNPQS
jgi:hypothetical protein